ncbi:MAG TPA: universal stress protein [Nitrosopumilaceae archaeon]|nr:universal stress protein [Nitrosopumilaceae archaeon]
MVTKADYKKIMVPFDGSKFSQNALETAIEISKKFGASLYLVTIIDISSVSPPGALLGSQKKMIVKSLDVIKSAAKYEAEKILLKKTSVCKNAGIDSHYDILEGTPSDIILKLIKKYDIDLVVIGSHGLSGFSKIKALGSASRRISEMSNCPVLIIH